MDETSFRARVDRERGWGTLRSHVGPWLLPCIWTECDRPGRREHLVAVREGEKALFYFFCSERHKRLWLNSPVAMGQLPAGSRGMVS